MSITPDFSKAKYQEAIDKLEEYQASEPDDQKREDAGNKITEYRQKLIDVAWDDIVGRTAELNSLTAELNTIIANASDTPSLGGAIAGLKNMVAEVGSAMRPGG